MRQRADAVGGGGSDAASPLIPRHGRDTLADLLPSIAAHLGVPGFDDDRLGLPAASRYVVYLVDGLGWQLVRRHVRELDYFAASLGDARAITSGVPASTVTSLTSLGTGLTPGQHGMAGYTFWLPGHERVLNPLLWDVDVPPEAVQPWPTVFDLARGAGVSCTSVSLERFAASGLTLAALRGPEFVGVASESDDDERLAKLVAAATRAPRTLVYGYERQLDHTGHALGTHSDAWLRHLVRIDAFCARLRDALPDDVVLVVTGDHGMVDVPRERQIIVEDDPALAADVSVVAGEGRFRQLQVRAGISPATVAARWADVLGERAWVRTADEATAEGWFGPVEPLMAGRFGQVLVALRGDWAVMTRTVPRELELVGMHGSLTPAEMQVPLFTDG